jgi:hypothetical protein
MFSSLCGSMLDRVKESDVEVCKKIFAEKLVDFASFNADPNILLSPELVVKVGNEVEKKKKKKKKKKKTEKAAAFSLGCCRAVFVLFFVLWKRTRFNRQKKKKEKKKKKKKKADKDFFSFAVLSKLQKQMPSPFMARIESAETPPKSETESVFFFFFFFFFVFSSCRRCHAIEAFVLGKVTLFIYFGFFLKKIFFFSFVS